MMSSSFLGQELKPRSSSIVGAQVRSMAPPVKTLQDSCISLAGTKVVPQWSMQRDWKRHSRLRACEVGRQHHARRSALLLT